MGFLAMIWNFIVSNIGWIILAIGAVVLLIIAILALWRAVVRHRYDRALVSEMQADAARVAPSALEAEVSVIPPEELPTDDNNIFMPVPAALSDMVDFISEERDGLIIRSCVRMEDADEMLTDAQAEGLKAVVFRDKIDEDGCAFLSTELLSSNFAPYSYVNLEILKKNGLVDASLTALSIRAEGVMRKPLMIEANAFSPAAVKMISLVGGRAVEVKRK